MLGVGLSGRWGHAVSTRYLVRPPPLEGESLSSWRQRLAWANGYRLFPVLDERTRRTDPDIKLTEREAGWLADLSMLPTDLIASMTIEGTTPDADRLTRSRHPLWVIPSRTYKSPRWGSMFCPDCLAENDEPYFRLQWRMAYVVSCPKHQRWLLDRCPACCHAPWPTGSSVKTVMSPAYTSHAICWSCGYDLRQLANQDQHDLAETVGEVAFQMREQLMGRIEPETSDQDLLQGLHALCQLSIRTRDLFSDHRLNSVEMYSVETRKDVLEQAFAWLHDWPKFFIQEITALGLTRASFNGRYKSLPAWIKVVVDGDLARQNRSVNKEVVQKTFVRLRSELGRHPSQADMRRVLGEAGDRYVRVLTEKRTVLSAEEIGLMHQRAKLLKIAAQKRSDMLCSFKRAALILSISMKCSMPLKDVAELSAEELLELVRGAPETLRGWLWGDVSIEDKEIACLAAGTARHLLKLSRSYMRSLMAPLPDDVLRGEEVVRSVIYCTNTAEDQFDRSRRTTGSMPS